MRLRTSVTPSTLLAISSTACFSSSECTSPRMSATPSLTSTLRRGTSRVRGSSPTLLRMLVLRRSSADISFRGRTGGAPRGLQGSPRTPGLAALAGGATCIRGVVTRAAGKRGRIIPAARTGDEGADREAHDSEEPVFQEAGAGRLPGTRDPFAALERHLARTASRFARRFAGCPGLRSPLEDLPRPQGRSTRTSGDTQSGLSRHPFPRFSAEHLRNLRASLV